MRRLPRSFLPYLVVPGLALATFLETCLIVRLVGQRTEPGAFPFAHAAARIVSVLSRSAGATTLLMYEGYVAQATVLVLDRSCTGFLADEPNLVVTAAHCIPHGVRRVDVLTARNERFSTLVYSIDRNTDLAVLRLPKPLDVPPLPLAIELPRANEPLLFAGRRDRPGTAQVGAVRRIGQCPSLPHVRRAIFTSIDARPGDSGAPVLDSELRVVGIIHGGARCHILAPVVPLARQLENERPGSHFQA